MPRSSFGQPGERESWTHGLETDVKTPYQQWAAQCKVTAIVLGLVYACVLAIVLQAAGRHHYNPPYVGFWRALWRALGEVGWAIVGTWWMPLPVFTFAAGWFDWDLVVRRLRAGVVSPGWPAATNAAEPGREAETYGEARDRMNKEQGAASEPVPGPQRWHVSADLVEGKNSIYLELSIDDPAHWYRYCKAWQNQIKPAWSVRGFGEFGIGDDYGAINAKFLSRGGVVVSKEYKDGRREYEPNARGRAFIRAFATTPPPKE